jgi:hypothetical protein
MDAYFLYFVLFSFVVISLILFILFFTDELKEIKGHFKWKQYVIYLLGSLFILASISLSYFVYLRGPIWLAILTFAAFNSTAVYFLYRASTIVREKE